MEEIKSTQPQTIKQIQRYTKISYDYEYKERMITLTSDGEH